MEESLIPTPESGQKKKDNKQKKSNKKKSLFCCCFGGSADQETDEDFHEDSYDRNGQSHHYDNNMNTAIPNSQYTNQDSEVYANQSNGQRSKAKKSPSKERKKDNDNSFNNSSGIIREQGEENNSSSSSQQKPNNKQNQQQSHPSNITKKNSVPVQVNQSNKKQSDNVYLSDGENMAMYDQPSHLSGGESYSKGGKGNTKKQKFNIKTFLQQYNQQQSELFHLYDKKKESYLLIKQMERNFQSNSILGSQGMMGNQAKSSMIQKGVVSSTLQNDPNSYFYNKNFKSDFDSQFNAIPEPICQYLASRMKNQLVVDAFCGVGYNTVQFAKEAHQVIAIDLNSVKVSHAKYNIEQFKLLHKVEVIQQDFIAMKRLKADIVVLHPDYKKGEASSVTSSLVGEDTIDLLNDVSPSLVEALQASFAISNNVVLILQKNCDIQQLPQILDQVNYTHKKFAVEVELMHIDRKFNLALVFIGDFASVSKEEVVDYYTKRLYESTNISNQIFYNKLKSVLVHLIHTSKIRGVSQLIDRCERNLEKQQNRKTLFQEFYGSLNENRGKIRSSDNLSFEIEGIGNTDKALKQLLQDIHEILNTNSKNNQKPQSPSSNQDIDGYQSSFSYNNNKFDFDSANKFQNKLKKKQQFNQSMQETQNDTSTNFSVQKSAITMNKLKGLGKNQGSQKRVEINNSVMKGYKGSETSSSNNPNNGSQQQNYSDEANSYANIEYDIPTSQDCEDDYGDSIPKIIYSCSYTTNTLAGSEISEINSLRPQLSNGVFLNGSTDVYDDQEFRNSLTNMNSGSNYYQRPLVKPTSSVTGGNGINREQFISGSLPNGSVKGQILQRDKNQKNNSSKNNLQEEHHRSASKMNLYYNQDFIDDGTDFDWQQVEEVAMDNYPKEKQPKQQQAVQTKIKNNNNTFQHNPDLDDSYKKNGVLTVPGSLS